MCDRVPLNLLAHLYAKLRSIHTDHPEYNYILSGTDSKEEEYVGV